jgi:gamma-glutamyltranspeptidase/glutathione hydrolase
MFLLRFLLRFLLCFIFIVGIGHYIVAVSIIDSQSRVHPVVGRDAMVSVQESVASQVGASILEKGGNAVDAAVAVGFSLAVTLPRAGNLGGGGFMMIYLASENRVLALDYRETAPLRATKTMYLHDDGGVDSTRSKYHILSTGVPGTVYGLLTAWENYGTLPLSVLMTPAIKLAKDGIIVTSDLVFSLNQVKSRLSSESRSVFFKPNGESYQVGDILRQPDLSWSLAQILKNGKSSFYQGKIAKKMIAFMAEKNGLITAEDLLQYEPVFRKPVTGNYRGYRIVSMPPPSSGGVHLIQLLNILESFNLLQMGHNSADYIHHLAEAMKLVYADRSQFLGDPDFVTVPISQLISKSYARQLAASISPTQSASSQDILPGHYLGEFEHPETTHYSIVDQWGNAVSNTYTLNFSYGNGIMVPGTGILLNNEMDDFSVKPGYPNAYGLIGGTYNEIAPKKRMLSSMTPTFVFDELNQLRLVTGTPGGSRIITIVLQQLLNLIDFKMNIAEATLVSRIHHQWLPDQLWFENGISYDTQLKLIGLGHRLKLSRAAGSLQSVWLNNDILYGASDSRKPGGQSVGVSL